MLGKLIKYEFKATYKFMLLLYLLLIIISLFMGFGNKMELNGAYHFARNESNTSAALDAVKLVLTILFVAINVVVISSVFFYSINRFRKNILGDGGYLYHTLPVKTHDHILAKCITSVVWSIASAVMVVFAYWLMIIIMSSDIAGVWKELFKVIEYYSTYILTLVLIALLTVVNIFSFYLQIYASMSAGYSFNTGRGIKSVGVFVIIMLVDSLVSVFADSITRQFSDRHNSNMLYLSLYETSFHTSGLVINIIFSAAFAVILFFVTRYFLKNRLNLQ